jgi:hypothetical protein
MDFGVKRGLHFGKEILDPLLFVENHRTCLLKVFGLLLYTGLAGENGYKVVDDFFLS